jgi:hypothetical protein
MSVPPIPNWCRMLGWGLLASLVLHWVVFDLMRVAAWLPAAPKVAALQVTMPEDVGRMTRDTESSAEAGIPVRPAMPAPASARTSPGVARTSLERELPHALPDAAPSLILSEGLRSAQPAEAMVALRLSIARSLAQSPGRLPVFSQALLLMCDFDVAGRLLVVRDMSGAAQPAMLLGVRRAVEQVVLPPILIGQAFSLDVLLEPGD